MLSAILHHIYCQSGLKLAQPVSMYGHYAVTGQWWCGDYTLTCLWKLAQPVSMCGYYAVTGQWWCGDYTLTCLWKLAQSVSMCGHYAVTGQWRCGDYTLTCLWKLAQPVSTYVVTMLWQSSDVVTILWPACGSLHSQFPHVVTISCCDRAAMMWWLYFHLLVEACTASFHVWSLCCDRAVMMWWLYFDLLVATEGNNGEFLETHCREIWFLKGNIVFLDIKTRS